MTFRKRILLVMGLSMIAALVACSSSSSTMTPPPPAITVTLSTTPTSLFVNDTTPVTATVRNDSANGGVTWSCAPAGTCGTFSSAASASGTAVTYTAPATVPSGTVVITATSATKTSISASTPAITINPASGITVTLSTPPPSSMTVSTTATIAATTSDTAGVSWSCAPVGSCGSFSLTPTPSTVTTIYTAPAAAGTVTVTATSVTDDAISASATVAITNVVVAPLLAAGKYVYYVSGEDNDLGVPAPYFVVGVFAVDASGAVTGGEQSFDDNIVYELDNISSSASSVVPGNNGNLLITIATCNGIVCTSTDPNIGVAGVETFDASMVSTTNGLLTEYDTWASGSGTLELQTSLAAPSGGYAFSLGGVDQFGGPLVIGGVINIDNVGGAGNISGAGSVFDENDDTALSPGELFAPSTVTGPDAFGQVVFTLNPQAPDGFTINEFQMVGYLVDADHIRWVENQFHDSTLGNTGGVALAQGSKTGTYSSTDISGTSGVFAMVGADTNGPLQTAGLLTFNADGSISGNVSFNDFVVLSPQGGSTLAAEGSPACTSGTAVTPCYTIDATGRVTIANVTDSTASPTFNYNFQLYLAHAGAVVISMDLNDWSAGLGYAQTGAGSFTASSFSGSYALSVDQQDTDSPTAFEYDGIGTVTADGTGTFTGFLDLNGILGTPLTPTPGTAGGVTGTFTANPNGVFTGSITGIDTVDATTADNFTFYLIGATSGASAGVIGIENDDEQLTLGLFELQ